MNTHYDYNDADGQMVLFGTDSSSVHFSSAL